MSLDNLLSKNTIGKQLIRSSDSIGANLAEGLGRGSYGETSRFAKIARGSLFEVKHWLRRAFQRNLLSPDEIKTLKEIIDELTPRLSACINSFKGNSYQYNLNALSTLPPTTNYPQSTTNHQQLILTTFMIGLITIATLCLGR